MTFMFLLISFKQYADLGKLSIFKYHQWKQDIPEVLSNNYLKGRGGTDQYIWHCQVFLGA